MALPRVGCQSILMGSEAPLPDDDTLVLAVNHHIPVHVVSQCIDVGGVLILRLENGWMNGWMNGWLGGRKDGGRWTMDVWEDERMDVQLKSSG